MFWKKDKIKQIEKINNKILKYKIQRDKFRRYAKKVTEWINKDKERIKKLEKELNPDELTMYFKTF